MPPQKKSRKPSSVSGNPPLRYPAEITERLLDLTQGHPHLLQRLCRNLVSIANRDGRYDMTMADLDDLDFLSTGGVGADGERKRRTDRTVRKERILSP